MTSYTDHSCTRTLNRTILCQWRDCSSATQCVKRQKLATPRPTASTVWKRRRPTTINRGINFIILNCSAVISEQNRRRLELRSLVITCPITNVYNNEFKVIQGHVITRWCRHTSAALRRSSSAARSVASRFSSTSRSFFLFSWSAQNSHQMLTVTAYNILYNAFDTDSFQCHVNSNHFEQQRAEC